MKQNAVSTIVLLDTTYTPSIDDYKEYLYDMLASEEEINSVTEDSDNYHNYIEFERECERDDFFANCRYSSACKSPVLVQGTLGLWDGKKVISPTFFDNFTDAVNQCMRNADDCRVELLNGVVYVYTYHHDGTNSFEIKPLSKTGVKMHEKLGKYAPDDVQICRWTKKYKGYLF